MVEVSLFGLLVGTLSSALSLVLVIVALTAVTYVAATLYTAMRALPGPERAARALGVATAALGVIAAIAGLRVGALGSGGELVPTAAIVIAGAAALGSTAACALLAGARGALALGAAGARRRAALAGVEQTRTLQIEEKERRRLEGDDLRDEVAGAEAALGRLRGAIQRLAEARDHLTAKRARAGSETAVEVQRALDEVTTKLELGERVLAAAEAATFRLACNEPLRRLARRRPTEATVGLEALDTVGAPGGASMIGRLEPAAAAIGVFLGELGAARTALDAVESKRPASATAGDEEDPWTLARRDLDALEEAYTAVLERVDVVCVRHQARARMEEVADAAGAVSASARARGEDQAELEELATEVTRAEAAVVMATPTDGDAKALTAALARSTAALGRTDGASLDELLKALRALV